MKSQFYNTQTKHTLVMATKTFFSVSNLSPLFFGVFLFIVRVIAFFDIDEIKSVHYGIEILKEPILLPKENLPQSVQLKSKFGQQYQCTFPDHNELEKHDEEVEKVAMETGIPELLRPLGEKPCLHTTKDWWSYEFCYGRYIRQYPTKDRKPLADVIYLGYFESECSWANSTEEEIALRKKHEVNRYHSQRYVNGTKCDLSGKDRKAEVRFMCDESNADYISQIDEPETCVYVLTVYTSTICHHPYLKAPTPSKPISITCNPVLAQEQYNAYLEHVQNEEREKEKLKEQLLDSGDSEHPVKEKESIPADLNKSWKIHLTESPEEAAAVFKDMLSSVSSSSDKLVKKSLFTDDNDESAEKDEQSVVSPSDDEDDEKEEKEESHQDETDDDVKKLDDAENDADTDSPIITTDAVSEGEPTTDGADGQNDAEDDEEDFTKNLDKVISVYKKQFSTAKVELQQVLQAQFKDLVTEAEDVLLDDQPEQRTNKMAATKKLAKTLELLNELEKSEREMKIADQAIEEHRRAFQKSKQKSNQKSSTSPNSAKTSQADDDSVKTSQADDDNPEEEQKKDETGSATTKSPVQTDQPVKETERRVKIRVTKIRNVGYTDKNLAEKEGQKLEKSQQEKLEKAGLESLGDKIQVRFIKVGYHDTDDVISKLLSDEDTAAFKNMIVAILGGNDETSKETERHKQLEENYSFVWQNGKQTKKPAPN